VLDTATHAAFFRDAYGLADDDTAVVFVGAEDDAFAAVDAAPTPSTTAVDGAGEGANDGPVTVLFYGQFIPLHGIGTIVEAARRSDPARVRWIVVGTGQEASRIEAELAAHPVPHLTWHRWVDYAELRRLIVEADVCLGVFGASEKAGRVIPNKVFQVLSVGRPLITRDSPGIRELLVEDEGVQLVPPDDPEALLAAVYRVHRERPGRRGRLHRGVVERFSRPALARAVEAAVTRAVHRRRR
jgi:glycosyltransferase involved in cell wall biosynthesis